jgi:hypothetical protein
MHILICEGANRDDVQIKIVCPELYLMGVAGYEDYYNFDIDETQWYEYTQE